MKNKKDIKDCLKIDKNSKTGLCWTQDVGKVKAGDEAFTAIKSGGYYGGSFNYKSYNAHQVIMFLEHGKWSNNQLHIDHIDGNKLNNKVDNLMPTEKYKAIIPQASQDYLYHSGMVRIDGELNMQVRSCIQVLIGI